MNENQLKQLYLIIGARVRVAREKAALSQGVLAQKVQLSRVSIVNIEKGRQRLPLHVLIGIASNLGIEATSLIPPMSELQTSWNSMILDKDSINSTIKQATKDRATRKRVAEVIENINATD